MSKLRAVLACVIVAAPVAGLALLDPGFGAGAVGGAAAALLVLGLRATRETAAGDELRAAVPVTATETAQAILSTREVGALPEELRHPGRLPLATDRYVNPGDSWEGDMLS